MKITHLICSAALAALAANYAQAEEKTVYIYNWSDYIDNQILEDFTKETGITVVYDVYDNNDILETKLLAGGSGYDIVVPSDNFLQRQIQAGVFMPLDKSKLPNLENMWDVITQKAELFDPGSNYSVDYMWGTNGIGYNADAIKQRLGIDTITSWSTVFDPESMAKLQDCGVSFLDSPDEMLPLALNYLGMNGDSHDPEELKRAGAVIEKIRPYITAFDSSSYINGLADGDTCLAIGYSGDILQARDRAEEAGNGIVIKYAIPDEGTMIWLDLFAIPKDAPHPDAAHTFINYMMRPEVIARASNYVFYANGNKASQQYLDDEVLNDPSIYPPDAVLEKLFLTTPYPPKIQRIVTRMWTQIKTGT